MNTNRRRETWKCLCVVLWALTIMWVVVTLGVNERVCRFGFCAPAAHLAALASGAPCTSETAGYRLSGAGFDLVVVPACAAVDFCGLLAGFLSVLMFWRGWSFASQLAVLPLAWILTVTSNAVRLVSCWQADRWACETLPATLWPSIHLVTGIATFLLTLTAVFWGMTRWRTAAVSMEPRRMT